MLDMIDAINTIESVSTEFSPATGGLQIERGDEIASLWSAHQNAKNVARATNEELRVLRANLGQQLSEMKKLLVKSGRSGQWSGFLREHQIPRATGDRLVARHLRSLNPESNLLTEPICEPTQEEIETLFKSILPRLQRILKTPRSIYRFVSLLTSRYECGEATDRGIMVLAPAALTICPESSDEGCFGEPEVCAAAVVGADEQAI
jgi:hypothetical protein